MLRVFFLLLTLSLPAQAQSIVFDPGHSQNCVAQAVNAPAPTGAPAK